MKPMVYLAGPIEGQSWDGATSWRAQASAMLIEAGIGATDPMRGKGYLANETSIRSEYAEHAMSTGRGLFARDTFDVRRADAILANVSGAKKPSIGTICELALAHEHRVPIVLVRGDDPYHRHPFIDAYIDYDVGTLERGIDILRYLLSPYVG